VAAALPEIGKDNTPVKAADPAVFNAALDVFSAT
jgi:hypothetical protein